MANRIVPVALVTIQKIGNEFHYYRYIRTPDGKRQCTNKGSSPTPLDESVVEQLRTDSGQCF